MASEAGMVLITGAGGFLGNLLATHLAADLRRTNTKLVLLDHLSPSPHRVPGALYVTGDIADDEFLARVITADVHSIYHLAALVSAGSEANYELGLRANVDGTKAIIKRCKDVGHCPRLVFSSSVAVYGPLPASVAGEDGAKEFTDTTTAYPQSSYGTQKVICELLISDATRRGFVDGRSLRLPTIIVRPGRPNTAASSFCSSIIREPLKGEAAVCPVDPDWPLFVQSPRTVVRNLMHAMSIKSLKGNERAITLPGLQTNPKEMVEALGAAGGDTKLVKWERDPAIEKIVYSWPGFVATPFANSLGFHVDRSIRDIVAAYIEDNKAN
jgi:nucleoside-diphosphate-sugar epimerase